MTQKRGKTQDLTSLCNPVKQMNLICLKFLLFYLLWVYPLLLSLSYTCIVMLNSWMFIHHTVKKKINLWTKMFLNSKSYFSVDTKVFIYLYMYYLSWYVFYINNIYMYILSLVLLINKYVCVSSICDFKSNAKCL